MNSISKLGVLLISLLVGTSAVACHGKPRPTSESAPRAEPTPAPAPSTRSSVKSPKLTDAECQKVINHVLEITAREAFDEEGAKMSAAEKSRHLAALRAELANEPEFKKQAESCDDEYTKTEYRCMMSATSGEAIEKCNESPN